MGLLRNINAAVRTYNQVRRLVDTIGKAKRAAGEVPDLAADPLSMSWQACRARCIDLAARHGLTLTQDKRLAGKRYSSWAACLVALQAYQRPAKPAKRPEVAKDTRKPAPRPAWVAEVEPARRGPAPAPRAAEGLPDWMRAPPVAAPVTTTDAQFDALWANVCKEMIP
jgi:hypothetical protein